MQEISPSDDGGPAVALALRAVGAKITAPRTRVLRCLQAAAAPMTHRDVLNVLREKADAAVDRVTVYRVLDWLVSMNLATKAADGQGIFRFSMNQADKPHDSHVHFRCSCCGGVFCLKDAPPPRPKLPKGFRLASVTVDIQGECAACAGRQVN